MKAADHIHLLKTENNNLQVRTTHEKSLLETISFIRMRSNYWKSPMRISSRILFPAKVSCHLKEMVKSLSDVVIYLTLLIRVTECYEHFLWPWAFLQRPCSSLFYAKLEVLDIFPNNGAPAEIFWKVGFLHAIFDNIAHETSTSRSVLSTSNEDLMRTSCSWLDQHVNLVNLRPLVTQMLKVNLLSIFQLDKNCGYCRNSVLRAPC